MSVCSQMGNGHTKGGKKKKKDLLKEVTCHDDDPTSFQQELENGDLNKTLEVEGSRQFLEEKSRRRDLLKDLGKLKIKSQEPPENAAGINPCSSGAPSSDCGVSQVNAGAQSDGRHIDDNNSLPQKAVQDDLTCKVQDGNDSNGPFDDQGHDLVDSPHPRSESERVPDDVPTGGPGQVNEPSDASESVHHGVTNDVPPGLSPDHDPLEGDSNGINVGATSSSPGLSPNHVLEGDSDGANVGAVSSIPGQANAGLSPNLELEGDSNRANLGAVSSSPGQANPGLVPDHALKGDSDGATVHVGAASSSPGQTNPGLDSHRAQQKMPTTGNDFSSDAEQERSGKASSQKQTDYVLDTTSNQSIPPTHQSEIESSTPSAMQIVPGLTKETLMKVVDQLTSKVITDNTLLLEKLSKYLDRESRVIKCWKHLAYVLDVPPEETRKFDMYTEHSPTEDLFNFLSDIWNPDLKVQELKIKLKTVHRNDVIDSLNKGGFKDEMKVSDLIFGQPKFIKLLSPKLDIESRTIGNWRSLATEFGIRKQKTEQFGLRGSGPTGALFLYMRTAEGLRDLTMGQLLGHFQLMERKDLVNILNKQQPEIEGSWLVRDVLVDGSELLADIGERLNKDIRAVKNWRNLAYRLEILPETYGAFDASKGMTKSPTKMMFEWLANWKPDLSVDDLLKGIKGIDRFDVVEIVTKEAQAAFEILAKKREAESIHQCNVVGANQRPTAEQVFYDLQQMCLSAKQVLYDLQQKCQDAEKMISEKTTCTLSSDLAKNARDKGFIVSDNPGQGDCMFHALSDQLELTKGIKLSAAQLRKELVQYLKEHPKLPDGTELFHFTTGYPTWTAYLEKMAKAGTWGDHVILVAAANCYHTGIRVISSLSGCNDIIINPDLPVCYSSDALVLGHVHEKHYVSLPPISVHDDVDFPRGNSQTPQRNGQDRHYLQSARNGEPLLHTKQQGDLQGKEYQRLQGTQQQQVNQQPQGYQQPQEFQQPDGYQHQQDNQQLCVYQHPPAYQQPHGDQKQQAGLSKDQRNAMEVRNLPLKDYSKICMKLNIKRDWSFDDFRMVAEELGMDRDTTECVGQQRNPTDLIFSQYHTSVTVGELVKILHKIERLDVAEVLEKWNDQGST